jgi:putative glutamine amidotransferase
MGSRRALLVQVRRSRPHAPDYDTLLERLSLAAERAVDAAGWEPHLVAAADTDGQDVIVQSAASDVTILLGGEDVDPALYGGPRRYPGAGAHEPHADRVTIAVIRHAVAHRVPLLGICRGHQLINVALGGTLVQDMAGHRGPAGAPFVRTAVPTATEDVVGATALRGPVLCSHHQAIDRLGTGLRVLARAADGTIEAVAHEHAPVVGVQWHPEHPDTAETQLPVLLDRVTAATASVR